MSENKLKFKILDCTLRDGGYYTNWDFDKGLVKTYFEAFNKLPVDYLEIGYRSNPMNNYLGEYFYCPDYVLEETRSWSDKKICIILNEKDVRAEHVPDLLSPCVGYVDMVRMAIDPKNFKRALSLAAAVKKLGFEVSLNVMYMSSWDTEKEFLAQIKEINGIVDYFYMVDSFGSVYPEDVKRIYDIVRNQTDTKLGFHGHNNLQLALINTLTAIDCGVSMVDATVTGMGRGAGNLQTELLLTALNGKNNLEVDFNSLSKTVDPFAAMQKEYDWGTNLPYMVSGANSLPQKEVMEWVSKRFYSFNSIIRALHNKTKGLEDNEKFPVFVLKNKYSETIIIGGGPSAVNHVEGIKNYVKSKKNDEVCLIHASSRNAKYYKNLGVDQYFCLIGSEGHRLEGIMQDLEGLKATCILPPYPRKMGTYVPKVILDSTFELGGYENKNGNPESPTVLAIELAGKLGCENIFTIGYDGYDDVVINQKEQELFLENDNIFSQYSNFSLSSLTPTKYSNLPVESVYSKLM